MLRSFKHNIYNKCNSNSHAQIFRYIEYKNIDHTFFDVWKYNYFKSEDSAINILNHILIVIKFCTINLSKIM